MTKNPYNLQKNPYKLSTPLQNTILVYDPAVTHPYTINKQNTTCCVTDHLLSYSRSIAGVIANWQQFEYKAWNDCKFESAKIINICKDCIVRP